VDGEVQKMVTQALSVRKEADQQLEEAARSRLVLSAKLFILGHKEVCVTVDQVHQEARGQC